MQFQLVDTILEQTEDRIVVLKNVSLAEEYLADHFPGFPVLPGVLMLETMTQAARALLAPIETGRLVLGEVRALKYAAMVRPGESLCVTVELVSARDDGSFALKGIGHVLRQGDTADTAETAVVGRFSLRPINS